MQPLSVYFAEAKQSTDGLLKLNGVLSDWIPFNRPHQLRIQQLTDTSITVLIPYVEANLNHVQGLHACGLSTAAEFASGILLLTHLDPDYYRILLQSISVQFHLLSRRDAVATFELEAQRLQNEIVAPLEEQGHVLIPTEVLVHDVAGRHLCTATVNWYMKRRPSR